MRATTVEQSKKLVELGIDPSTADMCYCNDGTSIKLDTTPYSVGVTMWKNYLVELIPCWSLAALLGVIKDKCGYFELVYLKQTYDGRANSLEDVYRLSAGVYGVYSKELIDACYEMILKLKEKELL